MDVPLCLEILRHAEHSGAENAIILVKKVVHHRELCKDHQFTRSVDRLPETKLFVQIGNGCAEAILQNKGGVAKTREACFEDVLKCCQSARLAHAWGQRSTPIQDELKRVQNIAPSAEIITKAECDENIAKSCQNSCFAPQCLTKEDFDLSGLVRELDAQFAAVRSMATLKTELVVEDVEETLCQNQNAQSLRYQESVVRQTLKLETRGESLELALPVYRFVEQSFKLADHPMLLAAADIAEALEKSALSDEVYSEQAPGLIVSGWGMAVLGHEASHLNVDVSPGGRIVMNIAECAAVPVQTGRCRGAGIRISLEGGLTREALFERIANQTIVVDAPDSWIRRNECMIDVRFRIVYDIKDGKPDRYYRPMTLRFDLRKMWFYCRFGAKPYVRISLRCGDGISDFQAPWAYFETEFKKW